MVDDLRRLTLSEFEIAAALAPDDGTAHLEHLPCGRIISDVDPYHPLSSLVSDAVAHRCVHPGPALDVSGDHG